MTVILACCILLCEIFALDKFLVAEITFKGQPRSWETTLLKFRASTFPPLPFPSFVSPFSFLLLPVADQNPVMLGLGLGLMAKIFSLGLEGLGLVSCLHHCSNLFTIFSYKISRDPAAYDCQTHKLGA